MTGEAEAAGALATAGLVAGVIEGREGALPVEGKCLNCEAPVSGHYCSQCGQHAQPIRSLRHVSAEFLHSLFHFDTKAWRTIPMVIFRPGTLTRNYVFGKRARYISPLATFLLCVFMLFFVFSTTGGADFGDGLNDGLNGTVQVTQEDLDEARAELAEAREALAEARRNPPPGEPEGLAEGLAEGAVEIAAADVARLEAQLAQQAERDAAAAEDAPPADDAEAPAETAPPETAAETPPDAAPQAPAAAGESEADGPFVGIRVGDETTIEEGGRWQDELREAVDRGDINVNLGHPYLNERATASLRNPDLALYRVQEAASKFSFLLAPLSLPFIALLFLWKRGTTFYDHVVYALYALSFASILFMVLMGGTALFGSNAVAMMSLSNVLLLVVLPVHTFFHLKGAYALGWWSALWRTFFMLIFAVLIAAVFFLLILILGLVG